MHDPHCLRLHSSPRDPLADLPAGEVIELPGMLTAPIITFDRAVLEVPFKDVAVQIYPSRSPASCNPCFRPHTLGAGKPR